MKRIASVTVIVPSVAVLPNPVFAMTKMPTMILIAMIILKKVFKVKSLFSHVDDGPVSL
jgi:cobalamin biosynthesis protein CobD/CbiB